MLFRSRRQLRSAPRDTVGGTPSGAASGDLYHSKRGEFNYANNNGHSVYTLQAYGRRVDFVTPDLADYREKGGTFQWAGLSSGAMRFSASAAYTKRDFDSLDREDVDLSVGVGVTYNLDRNVTITMEGGRTRRESSVALGSFVDNRVMLLLGYSSGPFYQVQSRR